jgi:hypothetical protein
MDERWLSFPRPPRDHTAHQHGCLLLSCSSRRTNGKESGPLVDVTAKTAVSSIYKVRDAETPEGTRSPSQ